MTENDRPNLSLGEPPRRLRQAGGASSRGWLLLLTILNAGILVGVLLLLGRVGTGGASTAASATGNVDELKMTAMQLEDKSLAAEAARAWQDYLDRAGDVPERSQILYRVGRLYLQADKPGQAAEALVRADIAAGEDKDLRAKIGPQMIDCLRRMGRYGEIDRELSRRVEVGGEKTGKGKVLATMAGEDLTEADLDRMIERRVDQMLPATGGDQAQREAILKQFSSPQMRQRLLQEMLQEQLFSRRARELKLDQEEEFLTLRQGLEQSLLAQRFLSRELEKIQPTDVDIEAFYKANKQQYEQPATMRALPIALKPDEKPAPLLTQIKSADDFRKLAQERAGKGGASAARQLTLGRYDSVLGAVDDLFKLEQGHWSERPHAVGDKKFLVLAESKSPARTPTLEEVRSRVRSDYTTRKHRELSKKLFRDLTSRYDVHLVQAQPEPAGQPSAEKEEAQKTQKKEEKAP